MKYKHLPPEEKWIIKGIPLLFIIGSIMHFVFELSGNNNIVAMFSPVNESVWEHLKMVLLPVILWWSLYYMVKGTEYNIDKNKWFTGALVALITALLTIPLLYYFYTEAFGVELLWVDILILFLAVLFGQLLGLHVYRYGKGINSTIVILLFIIIIIIFMIFTFYPPELPIFQDSSSGQYGIIQ